MTLISHGLILVGFHCPFFPHQVARLATTVSLHSIARPWVSRGQKPLYTSGTRELEVFVLKIWAIFNSCLEGAWLTYCGHQQGQKIVEEFLNLCPDCKPAVPAGAQLFPFQDINRRYLYIHALGFISFSSEDQDINGSCTQTEQFFAADRIFAFCTGKPELSPPQVLPARGTLDGHVHHAGDPPSLSYQVLLQQSWVRPQRGNLAQESDRQTTHSQCSTAFRSLCTIWPALGRPQHPRNVFHTCGSSFSGHEPHVRITAGRLTDLGGGACRSGCCSRMPA